jgi:hypothetical protein
MGEERLVLELSDLEGRRYPLSVHGHIEIGRVSVGAFVVPDLKRALVDVAYVKRETVSDVIRAALTEYVKRELGEVEPLPQSRA